MGAGSAAQRKAPGDAVTLTVWRTRRARRGLFREWRHMYHGERFNSITHVVGAALAAASGVLLVVVAARSGDPWKIVSFSVYAAMLLTLYLTSSLYHSVRGAAKDVLRKMDHCAIYLLIAGTYTPFMLVTMRGPWGWSLFGVVWGLALFGIVQEIWYAKGARILSLVIYVMMGWLAVVGIVPLIAALGWHGFAWLAAGGLFYTVGIAFYATDHRVRHGHGIWHLFVLGGSICHYIAVLFYVA
jgi:hemolysin III